VSSRIIRTRGEFVAVRYDVRVLATASGAILVAFVAAVVGVYTGNRPIPPTLVTEILAGDYSAATGFDVFTVIDNRVPRMMCAILAGAAFGISGAIFQRLTENPLGSPDLIGFSNGAAAGALVVIGFGAGTGIGTAAGALVGGLVAVAAVYLLAWQRGIDGFRILIVGIAVGAVLSAVSSYVLSRIEIRDAASGYRWLVGGLTGRSWSEVTVGVIGMCILVPLTVYLHRGLDRLASGAELASSQGLSVQRVRGFAALVGTGFVAVAVCIAGPVGFVALAAPHIARMVNRRPGPMLATSALFGSALLAVSDIVASRLFVVQDLPAGVVTAALGGIYLIWLLQFGRRGSRS
jgi:iron complex transport system permease protein